MWKHSSLDEKGILVWHGPINATAAVQTNRYASFLSKLDFQIKPMFSCTHVFLFGDRWSFPRRAATQVFVSVGSSLPFSY